MQNNGSKRGGGTLSYLIALLTIFALNFILPRMMPGDPLQALASGGGKQR
jgi:ABC-type dipeptide/oligopeptide/nickel transport system permease component